MLFLRILVSIYVCLVENSHFYQKSTESQDYLFLFSRQVLSSSRYNVGGSWSYSNVIYNNGIL